MTAINLVDDLAIYLRDKFERWKFVNKNGNEEPVKIFKGFMPEPRGVIVKGKSTRDGPDDYIANFPCIVITFVKLSEGEERGATPTTADVILTACTFDRTVTATGDDGTEQVIYDNHENQGWIDPLILLENIRLWLQTDRYIGRDGEKIFHLLPPLVITNGPVQEFPAYSAEMNLKFELFRPLQRRHWDYDFRPTEKSKPDLDNFSEVKQTWQNES